ncbi:universal stress protein [Corynebacterium sp. 320]|uniref:Universal stress protein n=1 Tax=Corynebacterium zhongnanshanii TaxID=2768834 RepID=A0ABQ6VIE1_9CORY|nr:MULTISPECIES: universal stress protein [Corynebacterium]KAB1503209.1 universal stress protein [Corynebacterium sp. 320]KAB1550578.1 universal stress protein [Corynebacterium sp. 321]KAB1550939.1 universal stress protein [Corynebacterium sp. 319]KAB3520006.1 universal stress protein [Corynebacterium zhongnanshanii]KAB3527006.1 universal stress protein [Corynebacterium sp. 250]
MADVKDIVVAVDGSEASTSAVAWAANCAWKRGEPLKLVSAYTMPQFMYADGMVPPPELYTELENEANAKLDDAIEVVKSVSTDIQYSTEVREAAPIDFLLNLSETAEMIVMGSRGLGGLSGLVMGSVSAAVVSHASCPVVVVRKDNELTEANKYGPVVVGVDGSDVSRQALAIAFKEADARKTTLRAIHSWQETQVHTSYVGVVESQSKLDSVIKQHQDMLSEELEGLLKQYPNVEVEEIVERERPIHALKEAATDAQLLITGSHGRGGFRGMLLGSTSRALLQYSPCPMMVVRPQK